MKILNLITVCVLLLCGTAFAEVLPPRPATQAEVNAGTDGTHPVTPKTFAGAGGGGGGSQTPWTSDIAGANHSLSGVNTIAASTLWATNMVTTTNAFAGTIIDFAKAESRTNASGNITFTGVANVTSGGLNSCIVTVAANGADRTIVFPAGFHTSRGSTLVVTNGTVADFLIRLQPGVWTNASQLDSL